MRYSYSFVNLYNQCSMKWYIRYRLKPELEDDLRPYNPLYLGILLEDIVKDGVDKAKKIYYNKYPIINNDHINEVIKASHFASQINEQIEVGQFEYKLETNDFIGYIDCLKLNEVGSYNIYDFKYSNYPDNYLKSMQLHLYKYYFEKITGNKVNKLKYIIAPKLFIRQKLDEDVIEFRNRLYDDLSKMSVKIYDIEYNESKVDEFFKTIEDMNKVERNIDKHCGYCEYAHFCLKE